MAAVDHIEVEDEGQAKLADLITTALLAAELGVVVWPCASLCAQCRLKDKKSITRIRTTNKQTNKQTHIRIYIKTHGHSQKRILYICIHTHIHSRIYMYTYEYKFPMPDLEILHAFR